MGRFEIGSKYSNFMAVLTGNTMDQFHLPEDEEKYDFFYEIVNILLLFINN